MGSTELIDSDFMGFEIRKSWESEEYTGTRYCPLEEGKLMRKIDKVFCSYRLSEVKDAIENFVKLENCFMTIEKQLDFLKENIGLKRE